jgi:uncharacterized protein
LKKYLPITLLALLVGCKIQVDPPATATTTPTPAAATGSVAMSTPAKGEKKTTGSAVPAAETSTTGGNKSTTPASPTTGIAETTAGATTSTGDTAPATATTVSDESKPGFNKDRIHQLSDIATVDLTINGQKLKAWVADVDPLRGEGLMFVRDKDMGPDQGMIFAFPNAGEQGFWMKHTLIPLDIAYIGADKKVVSTATMTALNEKSTPSHGAAQYVLEMKVGTLSRLGIQKGSEIGIPSSVKAMDPPQQPNQQQMMGG